jgi:nicotinate phosphoribosyltransferase
MHRSALFVDLYELTMAQVYYKEKIFAPATFSLFIRAYPQNRAFFVHAGLEEAVRYLQNFYFTAIELNYLQKTGLFTEDFLDYLKHLRFTGNVTAVPEGTVFFRDEPILEVTAPIIEAQMVETFVVNAIHFQTIIASKAARCRIAGGDRTLVDFSPRRTHGYDAGLQVARASYIGGFRATSNVLAGKWWEIPIVGTMAHSYITAFKEEIDSFRAFSNSFPENTILVVDTYDTVSGTYKAARVGLEMKQRGYTLRGIRLDSGDMISLSRIARKILDEFGLHETKIFASGGLDEYEITRFLEEGSPIDGFGVGTHLGVSEDAPSADIAYKLVEYNGRPIMKLSTDKVTLPGQKQIYRYYSDNGDMDHDLLCLHDEARPHGGFPLLEPVMVDGKTIWHEPIEEMRKRCTKQINRLPDSIKKLRSPLLYPVNKSRSLETLEQKTREKALTQVRRPTK